MLKIERFPASYLTFRKYHLKSYPYSGTSAWRLTGMHSYSIPHCYHPIHFRMQVGFTTLREFVSQRIPLRNQALKLLLDLTTHAGEFIYG